MNKLPICYVIQSTTTSRTYCGFTNNFKQRIRKHNGEIVGGAKYTRVGRPWVPLFIVEGFPTKNHALKFEWRIKHIRGIKRGKYNRILALEKVLEVFKELPLFVTWYDDELYKESLNKIVYPSGIHHRCV